MRIYVATSDGTRAPHFASLIPDDVRKNCDVADVVWSTNTTRDAAGKEDAGLWAAAAAQADAANTPLVCDFELQRDALDTFKADPAAFAAHLKTIGDMLDAVTMFHPDVRKGVYPALPAANGLPAGAFTPAERAAQLKAEREVVKPRTDFNVCEAYPEDVGDDFAVLKSWWAALNTELAERPDPLTDTYVLTMDSFADGPRAGKYVGAFVHTVMLTTAALRGKVMEWAPLAEGWPVIQQLSRK